MAGRNKSCLMRGNPLAPKGTPQTGSTDEHIVPVWVQEYFKIAGQQITPLLVRSVDLKPLDTRRHVLGAFKAGGVCELCNGGWMDKLERAAKPIVVALVEGTRTFQDLTDNERTILARWTLKTVAVLNRSSIYGKKSFEDARIVPDMHLRILASGMMPTDVLVVGSIYTAATGKDFNFLQNAYWSAPKNSAPLLKEHRDDSYKIGLRFGRLILIVGYYPSDEYAYGINSKACSPVWSRRRVAPVDHLWDDQVRSMSPELEAPMRNISVLSHAWLSIIDSMVIGKVQGMNGLIRPWWS
jgi:hypothetical protein